MTLIKENEQREAPEKKIILLSEAASKGPGTREEQKKDAFLSEQFWF